MVLKTKFNHCIKNIPIMLKFLAIFTAFIHMVKDQSYKFYESIMLRRQGEFHLQSINDYSLPKNISNYVSQYVRPENYCVRSKTNFYLIPKVINGKKNIEYLLYYSKIIENLSNSFSFVSFYNNDTFYSAMLIFFLILYFILKKDTTSLRQKISNCYKPSDYKIYTIDNQIYSSSTLVNSDNSISKASEKSVSAVEQDQLTEALLTSVSPDSNKSKNLFLPFDFSTNTKFGISDVVQKFYDQQLDQEKFLNENQRNEKLENFLFEMLEFNEENKTFLAIDLGKNYKLSNNNMIYNKIIEFFESKNFEGLNKVDISGFGEDLVLTNDLKNLKLTLFSINVLLNYISVNKRDLIKKVLLQNLSLILKKFHMIAETYGDEELFNYFLITIINLYSGLFNESVHINQLKKCMKTLVEVGCSSTIWNLRPKKCFFCCAIMMCSLRFHSIQQNFEELFPFQSIFNRDVKEDVKIKHLEFYLSICKILILNYIGRNINSVNEIDNFVQLITARVDTEETKNWQTVRTQLKEIQYIQEYYSDLKLYKK